MQGEWVAYAGTGRPVANDVEIHVRCRDNSEYTTNIPQYVDGWTWGACGHGYEIIAYKVVDRTDPD